MGDGRWWVVLGDCCMGRWVVVGGGGCWRAEGAECWVVWLGVNSWVPWSVVWRWAAGPKGLDWEVGAFPLPRGPWLVGRGWWPFTRGVEPKKILTVKIFNNAVKIF